MPQEDVAENENQGDDDELGKHSSSLGFGRAIARSAQSCYGHVKVHIGFGLFVVVVSATLARPLSASQEASQAECSPLVGELRYPSAALSGRMAGTVWMTVNFDKQGAVTSLQAKGHPIFVSEAENALRSAPLSEACAGQKVEMRFRFVIDQDVDPKTPTSARATAPVDYEIVTPSERIEVTISDPAWLFTRKGRFFHRVRRAFSKLKLW